jgi:Protein of unknown function (DUF3073)
MGRGRAKAKQVKVARQLKYNSGGTDLDRLRAELDAARADRDGDYDARRDGYAEHGDDDAGGDGAEDLDGDGDEDLDDDEEAWYRSGR